ncbi:Maf family protein [Pseudaestuariivita atlantica]|uniref:Nucleoside triphosphate pyrophosphatase n=1 Tax=Pseudaestuariivita atlantica TaxID=1317121 RepID=A0A0L1JPR0_9RHOB|nr:Maf family protein [Pseudaestuariivita atlantica]KNG93702.1 septum formation protein Maf [Pseudaestuariivita atlantica]
MSNLVLASGSAIRAEMLRKAGVSFDVDVPRIDEETVRRALQAEEAPPRDVADTLAEMKARKISDRHPGAMVLGSDQVLAMDGYIYSKPDSIEELRDQLTQLRGKRHSLISGAVICEDGEPVWRHVGVVHLSMRMFTDSYMEDYIARNWDSVRHSVGGYKIEEEGVRLFTRIDGDYFTILGMPLLPILSYLTSRDMLPQ